MSSMIIDGSSAVASKSVSSKGSPKSVASKSSSASGSLSISLFLSFSILKDGNWRMVIEEW
jgi:hypothetical protein